jgi:hypothetical protein
MIVRLYIYETVIRVRGELVTRLIAAYDEDQAKAIASDIQEAYFPDGKVRSVMRTNDVAYAYS